jgi:hypothetical protein
MLLVPGAPGGAFSGRIAAIAGFPHDGKAREAGIDNDSGASL